MSLNDDWHSMLPWEGGLDDAGIDDAPECAYLEQDSDATTILALLRNGPMSLAQLTEHAGATRQDVVLKCMQETGWISRATDRTYSLTPRGAAVLEEECSWET